MLLRKTPLRACLLLIAGAISLFATPLAHSKSRELTGYKLRQKSIEIGTLVLVVSDHGLRVTNEARGYIIVSRPPQWEVLICRPKEKVFASLPHDTWCKSSTMMLMIAAGSWDDDWSKRPSAACKYLSLPAHTYEMTYGKQRLHRDVLIDSNVVNDELYKTKTVMTVIDLKLPEPACRIIERLDGTPHMSGVPAQYDNLFTNGKTSRHLTTLECTSIPVAENLFAPPKDFKRVDARQLILSSSERTEFDALAREMDVGRTFGKTERSSNPKH